MRPVLPYFNASDIPVFGGLTVSGWSVLVVLGFVFGSRLAERRALRDGLDATLIEQLVVLVAIGVFVGGHLGSLLFYHSEKFFADPMEIFRFRFGLSSFGGFIACAGLGIWFFRRENRKRNSASAGGLPQINAWALADATIYGFPLGWFFGRMGCFVVHDHPGVTTEFWLGVQGICPGGPATVACHDLGLYEAFWSLGMLALFIMLDRKPRFPGFFVGLTFLAYAPTRFFMDFLRHPLTDVRFGGLTPAQYGCIGMLALGIWIVLKRQGIQPVRPLLRENSA